MLVNAQAERDVCLFNPSDCDLKYRLEFYRVVDKMETIAETPDSAATTKREFLVANGLKQSQIFCSRSNGTIFSRSHQIVKVRASPSYQKPYEFRLYCVVEREAMEGVDLSSQGMLIQSDETANRRILLCTITCTGVFPSLQITDARCEARSKNLLWHRLSLESLNDALKAHDDIRENLPFQGDENTKRRKSIGVDRAFGSASALQKKKSEMSKNAAYFFDFGAKLQK